MAHKKSFPMRNSYHVYVTKHSFPVLLTLGPSVFTSYVLS